MSTRCLTHVKEEDGTTLATMYRHCDGYPNGHGNDLLAFLEPMRLVNGIGSRDEENVANGMPCLAAQLIAHFKNDCRLGHIYLYPPDSNDCGEEYTYIVQPNKDDPTKTAVTCTDRKGHDVTIEDPA